MCGIRCCLLSSDAPVDSGVPEWLKRRGPDEQGSQIFDLSSTTHRKKNDENDESCLGVLQASVLCLRPSYTPQPVKVTWNQVVSNSKSLRVEREAYFCWNGEIYELLHEELNEDEAQDPSWLESDTKWMANKIQGILSDLTSFQERDAPDRNIGHNNDTFFVKALQQLLSSLHAEFAFCLVVPNQGVYYGRDTFGRRSLVLFDSLGMNENGAVWEVASVVDNSIKPTVADGTTKGPQWTEVPPSTLFHYNHEKRQTLAHPWVSNSARSKQQDEPYKLQQHLNKDGQHAEEALRHYQKELYNLLYNAVERRLRFQGGDHTSLHSRCAVLFSGGLDSVVLAYLVLKVCPPDQCDVQLVNVSFVKESNNDNEAIAADTKAACESLEDLKRIFPDRKLSFVHRKISWDEIQKVQEERIPHLLQPKEASESVMDLNIATALWFAADTSSNDNRILFSGLGADEYLGGYGRHRKAFEQGGKERLRQEMTLDQDRLWERNFGRDDRVLSDLGKEARYPFLDNHVTEFLRNHCPLEFVCDFSLPPGEGDKRLLRLLAHDVGLRSAGTAVKRAIQFGSRISHVVDKQRFGSRRQANRRKGTDEPDSGSQLPI